MNTSTLVDLDDPSEATFVIPYCSDDEDDEWDEHLPDDHEQGPELRWKAYTKAWGKCLGRIQDIIHQLHAPVIEAISQEIKESYSEPLPGLPHPELPVIAVSNPAGGTTFLDELRRHLDPDDDDVEPAIFTNHLSPAQCPSLTAGMKALISGFTDRPPDKNKAAKLPSARSLASYDISTLVAWYNAVKTHRVKRKKPLPLPHLVIMLHDFERFDPSVMQDMLYICSLHIPTIPIVFVVSLLSPQSPSYLHVTYPRSTLAVLRIRQFSVPSGPRLLEDIILDTFFNPGFEPDIMIGMSTMSFIMDNFARFDSSTEGLIKMLQLAHLKHFANECLALLCYDTPNDKELRSSALPDILFTRLVSEGDEHNGQWTLRHLTNKVVNARDLFSEVAQSKREGFGLVRLIYEFLSQRAIKNPNVTLLDLASNFLTSKMVEVKRVISSIRKLSTRDAATLLVNIHEYLESFETDEPETILELIEKLPEDDAKTFDKEIKRLTSELIDFLGDHLTEISQPFEELDLWEVWYTGLTPFPAELVNPSLRASLLSGLLRPHEFTDDDAEDLVQSIADLPDTSIVFTRYLESGRMINVYDLFESFRGVAEMQRVEAEIKGKGRASPKKGKGKSKVTDKKEEKRWQLECQARFIRALHELDYLGFVKHTGRKADHVIRTVFEVGDDE